MSANIPSREALDARLRELALKCVIAGQTTERHCSCAEIDFTDWPTDIRAACSFCRTVDAVADLLASTPRASEAPWIEEMRRQANFDRDNGRLNTLVDNHCLLDLLDALKAEGGRTPLASVREQVEAKASGVREAEVAEMKSLRGKVAALSRANEHWKSIALEHFPTAMEQCDEDAVVAAVTEIVRKADQTFERVGGSSRHWVRDCFLPTLNQYGWKVTILDAASRDPQETP